MVKHANDTLVIGATLKGSEVYLRECVESESEWASYKGVLKDFSEFTGHCVAHLISAYRVAAQAAAKDGKPHHLTVMLLIRHVCEFVDAISVLAREGCAESCKPLIRSAFEAMISVWYILDGRSQERALAYQVVHAHKKIKLYRKMMANEQAGKAFRKVMRSELPDTQIALPRLDYLNLIANLERMFLRPEFADIEKAWQAARKGRSRDPAWFSLFGGPSNICGLASQLKLGLWYDCLYRHWSDAVHAAGVLGNVARSADGRTVMKPLRHPDGLQALVSIAANICIRLSRRLIEYYAPDDSDLFREKYVSALQGRFLDISKKRPLINAPWR